jgi:hypothetical protein
MKWLGGFEKEALGCPYPFAGFEFRRNSPRSELTERKKGLFFLSVKASREWRRKMIGS